MSLHGHLSDDRMKRSREETIDSEANTTSIGSSTEVPPGKQPHFGSGRPERVVMKCSLPPHNKVIAFHSFEDFEIHYAEAHSNRCTECYKNFPTAHFLSLHISENHDPLREERKARGEKMVGIVAVQETHGTQRTKDLESINAL